MIYAIIPAFNEEENIKEVILRTKKYVNKIIVIDDGSKDKTSAVAKKAGAIVLSHKKNKGKGEGIRTAISFLKNKKYDYVVIIDADLQMYPEDTPKIIKKLKSGYDFVMGSRDMKTLPFRHRLGNLVWRTSFNIMFGSDMSDTNCGFIGFSKKTASKLRFVGGYIIETTMIASAIRNNLKVTNVPVRVKYHQISKVSRGMRVVTGVLISIIVDGIKYRLGIRP